MSSTLNSWAILNVIVDVLSAEIGRA